MINRTLLSIIIPTRNRQQYCLESIQNILTNIDANSEIVVQDNSDNNKLEGMLAALDDSRIVYRFHNSPVSFIDNFENALSLSSGEYFIILGDDDTVTKDILPIVQWMKDQNIESLAGKSVVDYIWPNDNILKYKTGEITVPEFLSFVRHETPEENLKQLIKNGFLSYQAFNLPRTYHGIIKRSIMDKIKEYTGRYFGGLTPDIYSTIALACVVKRHVVLDFPFSIAGACPKSATVNATVGGHSGKLSDAPHFNHRGEYEWENIIPRYYSVETIWAESAIKALKDMKKEYLLSDFDLYRLLVYGIFANRKYIFNLSIKESLEIRKFLDVNLVTHISKFFLKFLQVSIQKALKKNTQANPNIVIKENNVNNFNQALMIVYGKLDYPTFLRNLK